MAAQEFNWNRSWLKQVRPALDDSSSSHTPERVAMEAISDTPCLVLLGSPGMGKSHEITEAYKVAVQKTHHARLVSLRTVRGSADLTTLVQELSESAGAMKAVSIFLDGLDEAAVPVDLLFEWIMNAARLLAASRPHSENNLRITSRPAVWRVDFENDLSSIFGPESVGVYELCPLSSEDVGSAAASISKNSGAPIEPAELRDKYSEALFRLPITFLMLVDILSTGGTLPTRRIELYRRALIAILDRARDRHPAQSTLSSEERLLIAARLAACAILSNRHNIWTGVYSGTTPDEVLAIQDIAGGSETYLSSSFRVTENELRQVVETGIFVRQGNDLYTWSHLSFAEFLAGYYFASHAENTDDILRILTISSDQEHRLAPQMREVAAWTASMFPALFLELIRKEPLILLSSDAFQGDAQATKLLVSAMFEVAEQEEEFSWYRALAHRLNRLDHPDLAEQIRAIVTNQNLKTRTRSLAWQVASANRVASLVNEAAVTALSPDAPDEEKVDAIELLRLVGSAPEIGSLRSLLLQEKTAPLTDNLRGAVLRALWPNGLSQVELFAALKPIQNRDHVGSYSLLLHNLVLGDFDEAGAIAAVEWVQRFKPDGGYTQIYFRDLLSIALANAWKQIHHEKVLEAFANFFSVSTQDFFQLTHEFDFGEFKKQYTASDPLTHRKLLIKIRSILDETLFDRTVASPWELISRVDEDWIVEDLGASNRHFPTKWLIAALFWLTRGKSPDEIAPLWDLAESVPELAFSLQGRFSSDLSSQMSAWEKEDFYRRRNRKELPPKNISSVREKLTRETATDVSVWWRLNLALLDADDSKEQLSEFTSDLTSTPYWRDASDDERQQLIGFAERYLREQTVSIEECIRPNVFHRPGAAGVRALWLLRVAAASVFSELSAEIWEKWVPIALAVSMSDSSDSGSVRADLLKSGYEKAPEVFLSTLRKMISLNINVFEMSRLLVGFLDERIAEILWEYSPPSEMGWHARDNILSALVSAQFEPAIEFGRSGLEDIIAGRPLRTEDDARLAVVVASLLRNDPHNIWEQFSSATRANSDFARSVWEKIAQSNWAGTDVFWSQLHPSQNVEIFDWLNQLYFDPTPASDGTNISAGELTGRLKEKVLNQLATQASDESIAALRSIQSRYTSAPWIKWYTRQAEESLLRASWTWPSPREILEQIVSGRLPTLGTSRARTVESLSTLSSPDVVQLKIAEASSADVVVIPTAEEDLAAARVVARRILFVATEWLSSRGGISSLNRNLAVSMSKLGHEVLCLVPEASEYEIDFAAKDRVKLVSVGARQGFTPRELLASFDLDRLGTFKPEVVFGHNHVTGPIAKMLSERLANAKYVHCIHTIPHEIEPYKHGREGEPRHFGRGEEKAKAQLALCRDADLVLAIGPRIAEELIAELAGEAERVYELKPGLEEALLSMTRAAPSSGAKRVLFLGRQEDPELKGIGVAAEMLNSISSDASFSASSDLKLVIRGMDPGQSDQDISELCERHGIPPHKVIPRPYTTDAADLRNDLASCSLLIMPSRVEGFGLVGLEAISAGIPVLLGQNSGLVKLLSNLHQENSELSGWQNRVVTVGIDDKENGRVWAAAVHSVIRDRNGAFAEADAFRQKLVPVLSWSTSAKVLSARMERLLR